MLRCGRWGFRFPWSTLRQAVDHKVSRLSYIGEAGMLLDAMSPPALPYSARNASTGEMRLVRSAGTREATSADNPSVATATERHRVD